MTTVDERASRPQRVVVYVVVGLVLGGLLVPGYLLFRPARVNTGAVCAGPHVALVRAANDGAGPGTRLVRSPDAVSHAIRAHCPGKAG